VPKDIIVSLSVSEVLLHTLPDFSVSLRYGCTGQ
jgi:hypothetical protein